MSSDTASTAGKRRPVLVVEAPTSYSAAQASHSQYASRGVKGSSQAGQGKQSGTSQDAKTSRKRPREAEPTAADLLKKSFKEVRAFGSAQFTGRQKREHEAAKIVAIGGKAPKRKYVPFKMALGMRDKQRQREARAIAGESESGVVSGYSAMQQLSKRTHAKAAVTNSQRNRDSDKSGAFKSKRVDFGPAPSNGFVKNGVLSVNSKRK